jgi:hypothetical protein
MGSDNVYYIDDEHLFYCEYKAGDYISEDELLRVFSFVKGKIHSTGGNFY